MATDPHGLKARPLRPRGGRIVSVASSRGRPWSNTNCTMLRRASEKLLSSTVELAAWRAANASSFAPPICNKLIHKADLSIMCVGGPNTRTDFHLEAGAEFFWQIQGDMELPIVERGRRRLVTIREGEVFLLPPRIPVLSRVPRCENPRVYLSLETNYRDFRARDPGRPGP